MFSVVIPAYNAESTIYKVMNSVVNQTRVDLIKEIIIVNDGSNDNTEAIIFKFMSDFPEIYINYIVKPNGGASSARNLGIIRATSEWIALLDSDDLWKPNKIEVQYNAICQLQNCCFIGSAKYIYKPFKVTKRGVYKINAYDLCIKSCPTTPSVVFKKNVGIELGLFNEEMHCSEDINFFQKFLLKDSYYIIVDDLIEIGFQKKFFGESGASSNILEMARGRDINTRELYKMGMISRPFMDMMLLLNKVKLLRRRILYKHKA